MEELQIEEWQRHFVEAVIRSHNSTYSTHIMLKGRCESFYPTLMGKLRWDWVCMDNIAGTEIAIEVKRLMKDILEEREKLLLHDIGIPLQDSLRGKLPGTFRLLFLIKEGKFPLNGGKKTALLNALEREIIKIAPGLKLREIYQLGEKLTPNLGDGVSFSLEKVKNSNSELHLEPQFSYFGSILKGKALPMCLKELVQNANRQLGIARNMGIRETFLIVIMDEYGTATIQELQEVLAGLDHSNIHFCYLHDCWEGNKPTLLADWSS